MAKKAAKNFKRYESLRNELAQVGIAFWQQEASYPGIKFEFLEGDTRIQWTQWEDWISKHRCPPNDDMESWDVFPLNWMSRDDGAETRRGTCASGLCVRYFSKGGDVEAARRALERLAKRGAKILAQILGETQKGAAPGSNRIGCMKGGYRCFLDAVRNTAEIYQNAFLSVEHHTWGAKGDIRSEAQAMRHYMAQCEVAISKRETPPLGFHVVGLNPSIFSACGNAIRLWLEAATPNPMDEFVMYQFETITLPATASPDKSLSLMGGPLLMSDTRIKPHKKRGKKPALPGVRAKELRLYYRKKQPEYRLYENLAKDENRSVVELKRIINRVGKRLLRAKEKQDAT
jgi:hypothetical protein